MVSDLRTIALSRQTSEAWYDNVTDADAEQNVRKTYTTTYDEAGRVASAGDGVNDLQYTYSIFGLLSSTTQDLDGLSDQSGLHIFTRCAGPQDDGHGTESARTTITSIATFTTP